MITTDGSCTSLTYIYKNQELTWNFLNDKYLYYSTIIRIQQLYDIWGFKCNCLRCNAHFDDSRVFKCIKCTKSSIYVSYDIKYNKNGLDLDITTKFHDCFLCHYKLKSHEIQYYLSMEQRIDDILLTLINKNDMDFQGSLKHIENYLSKEHFKWFELYYSIINQFRNGKDHHLIFGKSYKYFLKKCYKSMDKIYNNCMNYCRWKIEWELLNCIINEKHQSLKATKAEKKLILKLFDSIQCIQKTNNKLFENIDDSVWKQIVQTVSRINEQHKI